MKKNIGAVRDERSESENFDRNPEEMAELREQMHKTLDELI